MARERAMRDAFVPWLAVVDPDTGQRKRRVARWSEIPVESQALLERLTKTRLIVRDVQSGVDGAPDEQTVEVAHEALLRQWPLLATWLDEQSEQLQMLEALRRAAMEWQRHDRSPGWLSHLDAKLQAAAVLVTEPRYKQLLGTGGNAYLDACRALDDSNRAEREAQQREVAAAQERTAAELLRTAKAQKIGRRLMAAVAVLVLAAAIAVVMQARTVSLQVSRVLVANAKQALADGDEARALRFGIIAARSSWLYPTVPEARPALVSLVARSRLELTIPHSRAVRNAMYNADGTRIVTISSINRVQFWDASTGRSVGVPIQLEDPGAVVQRLFSLSADGQYLATGVSNRVQVWDVRSGEAVGRPLEVDDFIYSAIFSPDGRSLALNGQSAATLWDVVTSLPLQVPTNEAGAAPSYLAFGPGGLIGLSWNGTDSVKVWSIQQDVQAALLGEPVKPSSSIWRAELSPDTQLLALLNDRYEIEIWDARTGEHRFTALGDDAPVRAVVWSRDSSQLLAVCDGGTSVWFDLKNGKQVSFDSLENYLPDFSPDAGRVVSAISTTQMQLWTPLGATVGLPISHREMVSSFLFSPDGKHLLTTDAEGVHVWNVDAGAQQETMEFEQRIESAAFGPDSRRVVMAMGYSGNAPKRSHVAGCEYAPTAW